MILKILLQSVVGLLVVHAISLDKINPLDSDEQKNVEILESLKEFVRIVEKYNLNVSIFGANEKFDSDSLKKSLGVRIDMPVNDECLTEGTLNEAKQDKYLKKLEILGNQEHTGARTRVFTRNDGSNYNSASHSVNPGCIIRSQIYQYWDQFQNAATLLQNELVNETSEVLHNYQIKHPSDNIKNVQIVTANVVIEEIDISAGFPKKVKDEIKKMLPGLWLSIEDESILARVLVKHLDKHFDGSFEVITGANKFALGGKEYVHLKVGNSYIVAFVY